MSSVSLYYLCPLPDETLSSWIYRCAKNPDCLSVSGEDIYRWFHGADRCSDYDFDMGSIRAQSIASELDVNREFLVEKFSARSKFLLHPNYRMAFCPFCLDEDVENNFLPYWRRYWCYSYSTHCLKHGVMLCVTSAREALSKAWVAFSDGAEDVAKSSGRFSCYGWRLDSSDRNCLLNSLTIRVQRWLMDLHSAESIYLPGSRTKFKADDVLCLTKNLLGVLLFMGSPNRGVGAARYFFNKSPHSRSSASVNYVGAMVQGAESGSPYQRMIALLFLGWVLGLLTDDDVAALCSLHKDGIRSWPSSKETLGRLAPEFRDDKEYSGFRSLFFDIPFDLLQHVRLYLSGIQSPYPQQRRSKEEAFVLREYGYTLARWKYLDIKY